MTSISKDLNEPRQNLDVDDLVSTEYEVEDSNVDDDLLHDMTTEGLKNEISRLESKQLQTFDIYRILIDTRKFEIENFWKRTIFFWGTLAILLAGYFNAKNSENFLIFVSYLGFFYTLIFSFSLRGSKYWQEHWEVASVFYERILNFKLFRWNLKKQIQDNSKGVFFLLRPHQFSVSKLTMLLSDITILLWIILVSKDISYLINHKLLHFSFSIQNKMDWFTIAVIATPTICILYLIIFLINGENRYHRN